MHARYEQEIFNFMLMDQPYDTIWSFEQMSSIPALIFT